MRNVLLLICLAALSFWPCFKADFVHWDDDRHLLDNPVAQTHSLTAIGVIFHSAINKTYIPLTILSFNIEHYFFGLNPFIFHLNNFILHVLVCLAIYALIIRMGMERMVAFLAALLFAIHPMHVESVAWVTQRKDVLYSLFYVLSILYYWKYLTYRRQGSYILSIACGILSILAKPMALSLPLTLLIFDWYYQNRITKQALLNKWSYIFAILPMAWITYELNSRTIEINIPESLLIFSWSATFYIKKFLTPFVLLPLYQLPQPVSLLNPSYASSALMIMAAPFVIYYLRKDRLFILAVSFYILSTFFLWRYDNAVDVTIVGDRFMYLPSLGICLWLASLLTEKIKERKPAWIVATCLLTVGMLTLTYRQCLVWHDDISLWQHELRYEQSSALAYNSYGVALSKLRRQQEALEALDQAIAIDPKYAIAFYNRGRVFVKQGQSQKALEDLTTSIALNPYHVNSYLERGTLLSRQEKLHEALDDLDTAERLDPQNAGVYNNRGIVYKKLGDLKLAQEDFTWALKLNPKLASAYVNRASVWKALHNEFRAEDDLRKAQQLGVKIK